MTIPPLDPVNDTGFEMSRFVPCDKINSRGVTEKAFAATEEECLNLAKRFDAISVQNFTGKVQMIYDKERKAFSISGNFEAEVTQECRTTFKPVSQSISEKFKELLVKNAEDLPSIEEAQERGQAIELLQGDEIDYGEIATQWLSLALDPYPRAEGAVFEHIEHDPSETNPFSALKAVKLENNEKK